MEMPVSKPVDGRYLTRGFLAGVQGSEEAPSQARGLSSGRQVTLTWTGWEPTREQGPDTATAGGLAGSVTLWHRPVSGSRSRFSLAHLTVIAQNICPQHTEYVSTGFLLPGCSWPTAGCQQLGLWEAVRCTFSTGGVCAPNSPCCSKVNSTAMIKGIREK